MQCSEVVDYAESACDATIILVTETRCLVKYVIVTVLFGFYALLGLAVFGMYRCTKTESEQREREVREREFAHDRVRSIRGKLDMQIPISDAEAVEYNFYASFVHDEVFNKNRRAIGEAVQGKIKSRVPITEEEAFEYAEFLRGPGAERQKELLKARGLAIREKIRTQVAITEKEAVQLTDYLTEFETEDWIRISHGILDAAAEARDK